MFLVLLLNVIACLFPHSTQAAELQDTLYFNHKYLADQALVLGGTVPVSNGQRAGMIPDLIGTAPMQYTGDTEEALPGSLPRYFKPSTDTEGYIFFDNVTNVKFSTNPLATAITGKRELWLVMRRPGKAGNFDAYIKSWNAGFFSDLGQESIGLTNSLGAQSNGVGIPYNVKTLIRLKLDGDNSEIFINNQRVTGPLAGGFFNEGDNAQWGNLVIGSEDHNAYWDWYASYYKQGSFTEPEASDIYQALAARHGIGQLPTQPYATGIKVVQQGDIFTVSYDFHSPAGLQENTGRTEYQFIYGGRGTGAAVQQSYYLPALADKKSFNRKDYMVGNTAGNPELFSYNGPYAWFRITVKVYDTAGNSWRFQTAEWVVDNNYPFATLPDALIFNHKYLADQALVYNGTAAVSDDQRAGLIPDLIGNAPMRYSGDNVAPLTGSFPKYFKPQPDKEGYIFFDNVADEKFSTSTMFNPALTGKRELWLVMRRPGLAASTEAYLNAYKSGYFADRGQAQIGLSNSKPQAIAVDGSVPIPFNSKTLVRIKLNGLESEIFINNVRVPGPLTGGYFSEGDNGVWENLVIGASTNNAYWDWYGSYYKLGNFTDQEAADVYNTLSVRHQIGTLPSLPYASDIKIVRINDNYSVQYTFHSPDGLQEDKTKTEYQFIYGKRGRTADIFGAFDMPAMADKKVINRLDYAVGNTAGNPELFSSIDVNAFAWFRMTVKVYDTAGKSWRFQSAAWVVDNEYDVTGYADNLYFNHKYLADQALVFGSTAPVSDNQRAGVIPDLVGNAPMQYSGDNATLLTESYPRYYKPPTDTEGYIFFDNVTDEKFSTIDPLNPAMTEKRELWLVMRRPGIVSSLKPYMDGWNSGYFADRGQDKIGLSNTGADPGAVSPDGSIGIPVNIKTLVRIKLNGPESEIYINGVRVPGPLPGGFFSEGGNALWENLVIGAANDNAYWDWYASYYKQGNFTTLQAKDIYAVLAARHGIGALPALPYVTELKVVKNGDVYAISYKFNSPQNLPEDKTKTRYQFIYGRRGGEPVIKESYYFADLSSQPSFNRRDYEVGNTAGKPELFSSTDQDAWFRITVKVFDTAGNTWRYQSTPWSQDNDYALAPLPVTLTLFDVQNQAGKARLTWHTATETNNLGFEVQGSGDGLAFVPLGFVPSRHTNSIQPAAYSFLDDNSPFRKGAVYYYRLKQVDLDGTPTFSKLVPWRQVAGIAGVLPTPFREEITVSLEALQQGQTEVILLDITGKTVHRQIFPVQVGTNRLGVHPPASLPRGMYIIQFETKGKTTRIKTLKA